jgi:hypothetical protein
MLLEKGALRVNKGHRAGKGLKVQLDHAVQAPRVNKEVRVYKELTAV